MSAQIGQLRAGGSSESPGPLNGCSQNPCSVQNPNRQKIPSEPTVTVNSFVYHFWAYNFCSPVTSSMPVESRGRNRHNSAVTRQSASRWPLPRAYACMCQLKGSVRTTARSTLFCMRYAVPFCRLHSKIDPQGVRNATFGMLLQNQVASHNIVAFKIGYLLHCSFEAAQLGF